MKKRFAPYLIMYLALLAVAGAALCGMPKGELHILLNSCHTAWLDVFFRLYTQLAEWPFYLVAALPLFCKRYRWWTAFYALCEVGNALITTLIKQCANMPRPAAYFGETITDKVPLVEGVNLHHWHSFPSGHTCTFFIFLTVIVLLRIYYQQGHKRLSAARLFCFDASNILLLCLAALGSYSRIYLSQHFLMDCFAGSILGVLIPCLVLTLFIRKGWDKRG